jgi:hypothetical protein
MSCGKTISLIAHARHRVRQKKIICGVLVQTEIQCALRVIALGARASRVFRVEDGQQGVDESL